MKTLTALLFCLPLSVLAGATSNCELLPTVNAGDNFQLTLPATPSAGYLWIVRTLPPHVALTGISTAVSEKCAGDRAGCGSITTLYLKAVTTGRGELVLQYARPWEPLPEARQVCDIDVR